MELFGLQRWFCRNFATRVCEKYAREDHSRRYCYGGLHGTAGIPDIIACVRGRFVAFEVKTPSNDLTDLQRMTIRKINEAGGIAVKVTSVEEVKRIIKNITEDEAV
ncbi:hypothetical protein AGMMS49992_32730 [Clostridia bacterium]|nr:hypothetical protein AGMMS49992_32730 [Clostridia bacterium]